MRFPLPALFVSIMVSLFLFFFDRLYAWSKGDYRDTYVTHL